MTKAFNAYLGKAGHLRVMSDFLIRAWNVAIPEVDVGDDIFVVRDESGTLQRVQVKTATAMDHKGTFSARFNMKAKQLENPAETLVHYVFIVRIRNGWTKPIIVRQDFLMAHMIESKIRATPQGDYNVYLSFGKANTVLCNKRSWKKYVEDFQDFPIIDH